MIFKMMDIINKKRDKIDKIVKITLIFDFIFTIFNIRNIDFLSVIQIYLSCYLLIFSFFLILVYITPIGRMAANRRQESKETDSYLRRFFLDVTSHSNLNYRLKVIFSALSYVLILSMFFIYFIKWIKNLVLIMKTFPNF